jgi:hypothetical protein
MNKEQVSKLNDLENYREQIDHILVQIEAILQVYFPEEFSVAYQHWIPQIKTALKSDPKWLSRGEYSMQYTINRIMDKLQNNNVKGVSKYIK